MRTLVPFLVILAFFGIAGPSAAGPQQAQPLSPEARVWVITVLPGEQVHALFGHTALRVHDPQTGLDVVYNYGTFDFSDPLFLPRFVYGQMDYFLSTHSYARAVDHYRDRERRPVLAQALNLTPAEVDSVYRLLQINALPQNRVYRYDFFFDNCSTRPRDVVEAVLGDRLRYTSADEEASFRDLLRPYLLERPFLRAGIDLLLGAPADRGATPRERMFLPLDLFRMLEQSTVARDGSHVPLVARTDTAAWVDGYRMPQRSLPWALILALVLLALGGWAAWREHSSGRRTPTWLDATLLAFVGSAGVLILFMWMISEHTVTGPNWNLLWAWPTHLVAAYLIQRGRAPRFTARYLAAASIFSAVFAVVWFFLPQQLPVAFLPLLLLVAVRTGVLWRRYSHATPDNG